MSGAGRKIQVVLDERMQRIVSSSGTIASTVRDAITFYDWCRRQVQDGWTICALRGNERREPMLPFDRRAP